MSDGIRLTGTYLRNFAGFDGAAGVSVEYPDGVSYLCGPNGSGKSTITIVQLQACIKGIAENQSGDKLLGSRFSFIGEAGKSADIVNRFKDERAGRTFSIKNHITDSANKITVQPDDDKPVPPEWMCEFLSVNLMSEKHFCGLSAKDQALALGVETKSFDDRIAELKVEYRAINKVISGFGEIVEIEPVEQVDINELKEKKKQITDHLNAQYVENRKENARRKADWEAQRNRYNAAIAETKKANEACEAIINRCEDALTALVAAGYAGGEVRAFIDSLPVPVPVHEFDTSEPEYVPEIPDRTPLDEIEAEIESAYEANARAEKYEEYLEKIDSLESTKKSLHDNEEKQASEKQARVEYIRQFNFGFSGLDTNEQGELQLNGRPIRNPYFSTGERIRIVAKLMRSRSPLFKTVFLDSFCELDDVAGPALLEELLADGFHPIVSIPRQQPVEGENCIVLRECKIVGNKDEGEKLI
jgi:energy-coupling factor transporter ATP-binding protein EcfA2